MKRRGCVEALAEHAFFAVVAAGALTILYTAGHLAVLWLTQP